MANNFDGLGIGFTAEDDGAVDVVESLSGSVNDLWDNLKKVGSTIPKMGKGIARGLGRIQASSSKAVGILGAGVGSLVEKAMSPELDSAYASMYANFNKEFSAMTAGMRDTEGRLEAGRKRIGGIAQGMGEDMQGAAKSWVAFEKQGVELDKLLGTKGLTGTIRRLIKVTSVYGVEGEQLAAIAGSLKKGFGFTEMQIGQLADEMVYLGREFNMGKEVIQGWQGSLESANKDLADFGKRATPENLRKYMLDMAKLGVVYHEALGIQAPQAMEAARESFSVFMAERKNIQQLARGMGGEFGPLLQGLLEAGESSDEVFKRIVEGDPVKFLEMMSKVASRAEEMGGEAGIAFQRLKGVISEAMGPDATYLVTGNMDEIQKKMQEVSQGMDRAAGTFGKVAEEHWKSSVTAGEAWDMMVNNMRAKVFRLSNKEIGKWKKNMQAGFKESFGVIEAMAKDKGPLGQLTTRLLAVQRVGISALLPGLGAMGPMLQGIASDALPMLTALGSMGVSFGDLGKLVGVGGAGYIFFKVMTEGPDKVIEQFSKMGDSLLDIAENKIFKGEKYKGVREWVSGFRKEIGDLGLFGALKKQFDEVDWGGLLDKALGKGADVINFLTDALERVPWGDVAEVVFKGIGTALRSMGNAVLGLFLDGDEVPEKDKSKIEQALTRAFRSILKSLKEVAIGAAKGLWDSVFDPSSLDKTLANVTKVATGAFGTLLVLSKGFRSKIFGMTKNMGLGVMKSFKAGAKSGAAGGGYKDVYGAGFAHLFPGMFGEAAMQPPPGMLDERTARPKPPPVPSRRRQEQIRQQAMQRQFQRQTAGGLSGGLFMGDMLPGDMMQSEQGLVRKGGLEAVGKRQGFFGRLGRRMKGGRLGKSVGRLGGAFRSLTSSVTTLGGKGVRALKGFGGALGGIGRMMAPLALIQGAMTGFEQIAERSKKISEINASEILSNQQKMAMESEATFMAVANTIDGMFMGLPSMIGEAMGVSGDEVKSFYHFMVGSIESGINTSVKLFLWLKDSVVAVWDKLSAHTERFIANVVHGFQSAKNWIVEIFYKVSDSIEDLFSGMTSTLMYPFEWLSHKLRGWMGDLIESIFGKVGEWGARQEFMSAIPGLDADMIRGLQKMGGDAIAAQKKELMGYSTFEEAHDARQEKARKKRDDERAKRDKKLASEQQAADDLLKNVERSTEAAIKRGTLENILGEGKKKVEEAARDHKNIMERTLENQRAAAEGEAAMAREKRMNEAMAQADQKAKEEEATRGGRRRRGRRGRVPSPEERAEAEVVDLKKYFKDEREFSKKERKDLIDAVMKSPLTAHLTVKLDGKTVAKTTEKVRRDKAAGTGL